MTDLDTIHSDLVKLQEWVKHGANMGTRHFYVRSRFPAPRFEGRL